MKTIMALYQFTLANPEVVSAYAAVGVLMLSVIGIFVGKAVSKKTIFKQKSGKNSQNIQGEQVEVNMKNNQWK